MLVDRARDLGEEVGGVPVAKLGGSVDRGANGATERCQAVGTTTIVSRSATASRGYSSDEPRRGWLVETTLHLVPSLEGRLTALGVGRGPELPQPWSTARAALFLSWAWLGLPSRAVHRDRGRRVLRVLFPGD